MKNAAQMGKPNAGKPRIAPTLSYGGEGRFDEGEVASENPRRGTLLCKRLTFALAALTLSASADGLKTMYGAASATAGAVRTAITWYSDEACTSQEGVITPWQVGSNACQYVILGTKKWTASSTLPDVPFYFGRDGVNVGTTAGDTPYVNLNCGQTFTFPNATMCHAQLSGNSDGTPDKWLGNYRFVKVAGKYVTFSASSVCTSTGNTRGHELAGKFTADDDVTVLFALGDSKTAAGYGRFLFSGDFSGFKGSMVQADEVPSACQDKMEFRLLSPTALGDTSSPRHDAFVFKRYAHIGIGPDVVQGTERGITLSLSAGQLCYLDNISYSGVDLSDWTLRAPVYGTTGTLTKIGSGNVTLAGSLEITNIVVESGTLTLEPAATFAPNTRLTVLSGGTVISRRGSTIENVTLDVKEGGTFCYDFNVACDGASVTTLDFTSLTVADRACMTKPAPLRLSQQLVFPINATNRLAVARFATAAGFQTTDFTNVTAKTFGYLPHDWFEMDSADGVDTLYLVVKPVIVRTGNGTFRPMTAQYIEKTTTPVWSDGLAAHYGADYVHTNSAHYSNTGTYGGYDDNTRTFPADSFYMKGQISMKSAKLILPITIFAGSAKFASVAGSPAQHCFSGGPYVFLCDQAFAATVDDYGAYSPHTYRLEAEIRGDSARTVTFSSPTNLPIVHQVLGTNALYFGKVVVSNQKNVSSYEQGSFVAIGHPHALGGDRETFAADKLTIQRFTRIRPLETMTIDQANLGITVSNGGFDVPENVTLTVDEPIVITTGSAFLKTGLGALKLEDEVSAGTVEVYGGSLLAGSDTNALAKASVRIHSGAGLAVDCAGGNEWGLFVPGEQGLVATDGQILVSVAGDIDAALDKLTLPICTVSSALGDLSGVFHLQSARTASGSMHGKLTKETLDGGLVRYTGTWARSGLCVIIK